MGQISPMMQKYLETKEQYKDCILFYRLGDFYEMFFDDAILVSKELELTLTGKDCGLEERAPMCGIPFHAVDTYLTKLVERGYKVAIGEQVEDPKQAKGLVKREVVRIVTPGTNLDTSSLDETKNNYLMCIVYASEAYGIAVTDITTGEFYVTEVSSSRMVVDEINRYMPTEIVVNSSFYLSGIDTDDLKNRLGISIFTLENWYFQDEICINTLKEHFKVADISGLGINDYPSGIIASGTLMKYLLETQKISLSHIISITPYSTGKYMVIDTSTRRNLEITETLREKQKRGSLLWVLDKTKTAMGARLLRKYTLQPLIQKDEIRQRQDAIEELNKSLMIRDEIREYLGPIYDMERIMGKVAYKSVNPRDLISFKNSLEMLPHIKNLLKEFNKPLLKDLYESFDELDDIYQLINEAIDDDPPLVIRDGGIIKTGYCEEIDKLRNAKSEGKTWLAELEAKEREATGIKNLKIKYNRVFGYFLEVTNSFKNLVPDRYIRKQTMTNAERFITDELKELEDIILGAEEKLSAIEYEKFCLVRDTISGETDRIKKTAEIVAKIDVFTSLAFVAERNDYVKPAINDKGIIDIKNGRHPVVEKIMNGTLFVENDTYLDKQKNRISIITGPNMAGKSTYMRQTALIVLMAQIGSFVPAKSANICVCDRIFTRVGASDDLSSGQSTFMVEMTEVSNIIRNATADSLLILDEIGRGTSTFDGLSIAWAVVEHIANTKLLGAKTLFATHYHELTELEGTLPGVNNYCIAVKEQGDDIIFLRKIVKGGADKSYGIQVAKLAGIPESVINRAKEIVKQLTEADISAKAKEIANQSKPAKKNHEFRVDDMDATQMSLFDTVKDDDILTELANIDISNLTPIEALNTIYRLQNKLKNRW